MKTSELKKLLLDTFGHLDDAKLLGLLMFGEARGETDQGRIAVGSVVMERVDHRDWDGKTIKEICLMPYQFSCFLPNDPNFPKLKKIAEDWGNNVSPMLNNCHYLAKGLLSGVIPRDIFVTKNHCTQYKTIDCKVAWAEKMRKVATINRHEFYA